MKTFVAKPHEVQRDWFVIDAKGKVLGRVASEVARRLRGKHKPEFTPHVDTGDYIVIINASDIVVTGTKAKDKKYFRHTTYPGGIRETNFEKMQERFPGRAIQKAVKGMLPKGPLLRHDQEAEGLCWCRAPAHRPAAQDAGYLRKRHDR